MAFLKLTEKGMEKLKKLNEKRLDKLANLEETLLKYRVYKNSFTQSLKPEKKLASATNTIKNIERYSTLSEMEKSQYFILKTSACRPG